MNASTVSHVGSLVNHAFRAAPRNNELKKRLQLFLTSQAMSAWQGPPEGWACSGSGAMRSNNLSPLAALYVTPKSLPLVRVEGHNISQSCSGDK